MVKCALFVDRQHQHRHEQIIVDKGARDVQWTEESLFTERRRQYWKDTGKRTKLDYNLSSCTNIT